MSETIHFIGIGGVGVSALAQVAAARGARVSGSDTSADRSANPALDRLARQGAAIYAGHREENLAPDVTLVVATAAVDSSNPEIAAALRRGVRVVSRAAYLGELMAAHSGPKIAIAGTHGKTTTTGMIGVMLQAAGADPTVFVGGEVPQLGGNVRIGGPEGMFAAEACEAYDSFLHLKPDIAVVTNIEADHLDHYDNEAGVFAAFAHFLSGVDSGGAIVANADDAGVRRLIREMGGTLPGRLVLYGIESPDAEYRAASVRVDRAATFRPEGPGFATATAVRLRVPGRHNIENALAAAAVGRLLDIDRSLITSGLSEFSGVGRRQDSLGEFALGSGTVLVMDDYAHHPTEIRATLSALRSAHPGRRLVALFQPHLFSRTRDFLSEFAHALAVADLLLVTDIYPAREAPIAGVRAEAIVELARQENGALEAHYLEDRREAPAALQALVRPGDLVVTLGAGNIREQAEAFAQSLRESEVAA